VAVKIKLKRLGKIRAPYYRIIVADARTKRDGRAIEEIGKYHPKAEPSFIEVNSERAQHWLSVGAQPTDPVRKILEITGDWQKFKGLPGAEGTLKTAAPKEDRKAIFAAAVKETLGEGTTATKSRGKSSAGKEADSGPEKSPEKGADKGGKAAKDAGPAKADRPARGKTGEQPGRARSGERRAAAKDAAPKDAAPKDAAAKGKAKGAAAEASGDAADDSAAKAQADDAPAAEAQAAEAQAAEAQAAEAQADDAPAAEATADSEPASGD
jgi:small subunit ribosomal protein S16